MAFPITNFLVRHHQKSPIGDSMEAYLVPDVRGCTHALNLLIYQRLSLFLLVGRWQSLRSIDEDKKAICAVQGLNISQSLKRFQRSNQGTSLRFYIERVVYNG